jgi:hypothetical protein
VSQLDLSNHALAGEPPGRVSAAIARLQDERTRFLFVWILPFLVGALVSFAPQILNDGDTFWHVAAGRWMIAHRAVPATDPFSFTYAGRPWMAHEWLSEVAMAGAYLAAGWAGVMLLTGLAIGALTLQMGAWLARWLSPIAAICALILGLACVAPGMLARPHLLVLPLLALWTIRLMKAREEARAPGLWTALLMALWANLHSSFVVGYALAAAFALEALLDFKAWNRRSLIGWAAFLGASLVATLATPHGVDGLAFPLKVLDMKTLPFITEWQSPDFMKLSTLELALLAGLFALFWKGARLTAVRALILLGLAHMSFQHVRQEVLLGVVGPLILAEPLGRALGAAAPKTIRWAVPLPQTLLGTALILAALVGRLIMPQPRLDGPTAPITALAHVPPALRAQPVLNAYDFGGYLIFAGVKPYIDGRADMYGDAFVADHHQIMYASQSAMDAAIARYHLRWAILQPDLPITGALDRTAGWKRLYTDEHAVVLVNTGP